MFPGLAEDSWFTLGSKTDGISHSTAGLTKLWLHIENDEGFVVDNVAGGGMFIVPGGSTDALAGDELKVLLPIHAADGHLQFNLQWKPQGGLIIEPNPPSAHHSELVAPMRRRAAMHPRWSMTEAVLSHLMNILIVTGHLNGRQRRGV